MVHSPTVRKHVPFLFGGSLAVHCCSGWVISLKFVKKGSMVKLKTCKLYSSFVDQLKSSLSGHKPSHSSQACKHKGCWNKEQQDGGWLDFPFLWLAVALVCWGGFFFFLPLLTVTRRKCCHTKDPEKYWFMYAKFSFSQHFLKRNKQTNMWFIYLFIHLTNIYGVPTMSGIVLSSQEYRNELKHVSSSSGELVCSGRPRN